MWILPQKCVFFKTKLRPQTAWGWAILPAEEACVCHSSCTQLCSVCSTPLLTVLTRRLESRSVTECFSLGCNCKWKLNLRACKCKITDTVQKYDLHSKLGCSIPLACLYYLASQRRTSLFDPSIKACSELLLAPPPPPPLQGRGATVIYLRYLLTLCVEISRQRCSINALVAIIM